MIYVGTNTNTYFAIVAGYAVLISTMVGATAWLLLRDLVLVRSLAALPTVPLASAVRTRLKPIADFHVRIAIDWSIGASLFFVLFFRTPDLISVVAIASLTIVAVAAFAAPQFYLTNVVRRAHEKACALVLRDYQETVLINPLASTRTDYIKAKLD